MPKNHKGESTVSYQNVLFEKSNGIGILTINRPKVLNALNKATMLEIKDVIGKITSDPEVAVVIVTGSGDKAFVAGADISEMQNMSALEGRAWGKFSQQIFNEIENLPQPVIAAVNGYALGGGCELAMCCDIRIASDKAKFGQPEVLLGVIPGFAGTQRLPRLIGKGRAKELIFLGDQIDAQEAFRIGLVNKLVPADQLMAVAKATAEKIISRGPVAVKLGKAAINEGMDMDFESGQAYEAEVFGLCFATSDQKEGMSAFLEKRKANFTGK
jgi:enoyl-CoA hydratase